MNKPLSWDKYIAETDTPIKNWNVDGVRIYDREVDKFIELWKIWRMDERARPQWHLAPLAADIQKYSERFEKPPSVEIRMILTAQNLRRANTTIHRWISEQSGLA